MSFLECGVRRPVDGWLRRSARADKCSSYDDKSEGNAWAYVEQGAT